MNDDDIMPKANQWRDVAQAFFRIAKKQPLKFPFQFFAIWSQASSFMDHPVLGDLALNQLGLHRYRVALAAKMTAKRRKKIAVELSAADVAAFERDGFILKKDFLAAEQFQQLRQELLSEPLLCREMAQGDTITRRLALDATALKKLPATKKLLEDSYWQSMLAYVASFRSQPMYYVQTIFSQVKAAKPDPQTALHSDTFHSSAKAWLFLTDVEADEGPFVYAPGSHNLNEKRLAWEHQRAINIEQKDRLSKRGSQRADIDTLAVLDYQPAQSFAVSANTLVVADTYGFHARGLSVRPSVRIELWAYVRRNPFTPWVGWDVLKLPMIRYRIVPFYWKALDWIEHRGIKRSPWRHSGHKRAAD